MSKIDILSIIKLADELEKQVKTLRSGDPEWANVPIPALLPSPEIEESPDPKTHHRFLSHYKDPNKIIDPTDPYEIGHDLLNFGPKDRDFDPIFSEGCQELKHKFQQLETCCRVASGTASTKNSVLVYDFNSESSIVNLLKTMRKLMEEIQVIYEELP